MLRRETGDLSRWYSNTNDGGDLKAATACAMVGAYGMQANLDDNNPIFVLDETPASEPRYRARFYFKPNAITMANGDSHTIFQGISGGASKAVLRIQFRKNTSGYQVQAGLLNDSGTWKNSSWITISDAPTTLEVDWKAAGGAGQNNGYLTFWVGGVQKANLTGVDNDTWKITRAKLGAVTRIDSGTRGKYCFDAFESHRTTPISQSVDMQDTTFEPLYDNPALFAPEE